MVNGNGISGVLATARTNIQNQLNTVRTNIQSTRTSLMGSRQAGQASLMSQFRASRGQGLLGGQQGGILQGMSIMQAPNGARETGIPAINEVKTKGVLGFLRGRLAPAGGNAEQKFELEEAVAQAPVGRLGKVPTGFNIK